MGKLIGIVLGVALIAGGLAVRSGEALAKKPTLMWGDSLAYESRVFMSDQFVNNPTWTLWRHPAAGKAPCDYLPGATKILSGSTHYAVLAIETAGNSGSPCMRIPGSCLRCYLPIGSAAWEAKYRADLNALVDLADSHGTAFLFISPPPFAGLGDNRNDVRTTVEPQLAVDRPEVHFTDDPRASVANSDAFASTLPCLSTETAADGCTDGMITVRAPDGTHFCPTGYTATCPEYSSGAVRFGTAMGQAIIAAANATLAYQKNAKNSPIDGM